MICCKTLLASLALLCLSSFARGQLQLPGSGHVHIDFSGYTGGGFQPIPSAGQLTSNDWAATGMSDGTLDFGGVRTSGDFARGISTGGITTPGFYGFDLGGGNTVFGIQPGGIDWNPGTLTLRLQNGTGADLTKLNIEYKIYVRNDAPRSSSLNFSYSLDGSSYTALSALDFSSPETADGLGFVLSIRSTTITSFTVPAGGFIYVRWMSQDVSGAGARDEFGLDDITLSAGDEPLPVEVLSFAASISGSSVELRWTTVTEVNNFGFSVQRRTDGEPSFLDLPGSFTAGHGTTNNSEEYTYLDRVGVPGRYEYRLKQINLDGTVQYPQPIKIDLKKQNLIEAIPTEFSLSQNYPNPFNPTTVVSYQLPTSSGVRLAVYDILGRELMVPVNEKKGPGSYEVRFDAAGLSSGVYLYRLTAGHFDKTRMMIFIK